MQFRLACNKIRSIQSLLRIVRLVSSSLMIARKRVPTVLSFDSLAEFSMLLDNPCDMALRLLIEDGSVSHSVRLSSELFAIQFHSFPYAGARRLDLKA